ncbi:MULTISPECIES: hypothetical protein [unclassified Coleofasciculus]|uniref:hypothetical protein n=1 Tax=unclassified Coleofasciculus TaxID=2692782 RepID=UPI002AD4E44C|nr:MULTISPECIES: hypothetical protein [unclassified Coleofasciculus]
MNLVETFRRNVSTRVCPIAFTCWKAIPNHFSYLEFGKSVDYFQQQNCLPAFKECFREYKELGSHALQATIKRVEKKSLSQRVHQCSSCGYTEDRDVASAIVCVNYALGVGTTLTNVDDSSSTTKTRKHTGAMSQLGQMKRKKLRPCN